MTPRFYRVGPAIWDQPWEDDVRLVALYLLSNPHRTTEGLYRLPLAYAAADLRWKAGRVEKALEKLIEAEFVKYDEVAQVVWIVKALAWQAPTNPNQVKGAAKALRSLPQTSLFEDFMTACAQHCDPLHKELSNHGPKAGSKAGPPPVGKPVSNTPSPSPSPSPPSPPRGDDEARQRAAPLSAVQSPAESSRPKPLKFKGRVVPQPQQVIAYALLREFNQHAGTNYKPHDAKGQPSESLKRILGALVAQPDITAEVGGQMIAAAFRDPFWKDTTPHPGVVFGPGVVERNLEAASAAGRNTNESLAALAERMNERATA